MSDQSRHVYGCILALTADAMGVKAAREINIYCGIHPPNKFHEIHIGSHHPFPESDYINQSSRKFIAF